MKESDEKKSSRAAYQIGGKVFQLEDAKMLLEKVGKKLNDLQREKVEAFIAFGSYSEAARRLDLAAPAPVQRAVGALIALGEREGIEFGSGEGRCPTCHQVIAKK